MTRDRGQITGEALLIALGAAIAWYLGSEVWAGLQWLGSHLAGGALVVWHTLKRIPR